MMKKILIYPAIIENEALGDLTKKLIDSGVFCFRVRITCLEFEIEIENVSAFKERIEHILPSGSYNFSI